MCYNLIGQRCVLHKEWSIIESSLVLQCNFLQFSFLWRKDFLSFLLYFFLSIYLYVVSNKKKSLFRMEQIRVYSYEQPDHAGCVWLGSQRISSGPWVSNSAKTWIQNPVVHTHVLQYYFPNSNFLQGFHAPMTNPITITLTNNLYPSFCPVILMPSTTLLFEDS